MKMSLNTYLLLLAMLMVACGTPSGQHYAWPLGTSSPENTVTQIFA